jgi:hypothetical protein
VAAWLSEKNSPPGWEFSRLGEENFFVTHKKKIQIFLRSDPGRNRVCSGSFMFPSLAAGESF